MRYILKKYYTRWRKQFKVEYFKECFTAMYRKKIPTHWSIYGETVARIVHICIINDNFTRLTNMFVSSLSPLSRLITMYGTMMWMCDTWSYRDPLDTIRSIAQRTIVWRKKRSSMYPVKDLSEDLLMCVCNSLVYNHSSTKNGRSVVYHACHPGWSTSFVASIHSVDYIDRVPTRLLAEKWRNSTDPAHRHHTFFLGRGPLLCDEITYNQFKPDYKRIGFIYSVTHHHRHYYQDQVGVAVGRSPLYEKPLPDVLDDIDPFLCRDYFIVEKP